MGLKLKWNKNLAIAVGLVVAVFVVGGLIYWTTKKNKTEGRDLSSDHQEMEKMMNEQINQVSPAIQQAPNMRMSQQQMGHQQGMQYQQQMDHQQGMQRMVPGINAPQDKTQMEMQYGSPMGYDPRTDGFGVGQGLANSPPQNQQFEYL